MMDLSGSFASQAAEPITWLARPGRMVSPELLTSLLDGKLGIWRMEPASRFVELDEAGADLLGVPPFCPLSPDLPQIARFLDHLPDPASPLWRDRIDRSFPFPLADGTHGWLYVNARQDAATGMLFGFVKDVTQYKALELEARESEKRLLAILENLPGICYRCLPDPPWRMVFVNSEIEAITGHPPDAFLDGRLVWEDLILPEDRDAVRSEVTEAIDARRRFDIRYRIMDRTGCVRWLFERGSAQLLDDGTPFEIEGLIFDITEAMHARQRLEETEERYRLICQSTMDLVYEHDLVSHQVVAHCQHAAFMGHDLGSIPTTSAWWIKRIHPEDRPRVVRELTETLAGDGNRFASEHRFERADGSYAETLATAFVQRDRAGRPVKLIGALQDLSHHQAMVAALKASEAFNRSIVDASQDCIKLLDREGNLLFINAFGLQAMGVRNAQTIIGRSLLSFWPREAHKRIRKALARARSGGTGHFAGQCRMPDGALRAWDVLISPLASGKDQPDRLLAISRDITERLETERRLMEAATIDSLTGLPNRRYFLHQLGERIAGAAASDSMFGILILDLDGFKQINDTMGHDAGDAMLCTVAQRLRNLSRPDVLCARLAGDEFAVLATGIRSAEDLVMLGNAILRKLREPFVHAERMLDGHATIGTAIWPKDGKTVSELLKSADLALYAAKKERPGSVMPFVAEHRREMRAHTTMLRRAREALRRDAVEPFYQPIIAIDDGLIAGYEALMRLRRPATQAVLQPSAVKAAFDDPELAKALGMAMIRAIAADMARWLDAGVAFGRIAINASAADLRHADYCDGLLSAFADAGVPPALLKLKVTETVFLGRAANNVRRTIDELCAHGVDILLDDFGTGYASLVHLRDLPIRGIKIDQGFIARLQSSKNDRVMVETIISLGHKLGLDVIAEGVETAGQLGLLRSLGCHLIQGFHFSPAVPAGTVARRWPSGRWSRRDGLHQMIGGPSQSPGKRARAPGQGPEPGCRASVLGRAVMHRDRSHRVRG